MKNDADNIGVEEIKYEKPQTEKHEPVKLILGSDDECRSLYCCSSLYALYVE